MSVAVHAVDQPDLPPFIMSDRFRHDIAYFMQIRDESPGPPPAAGEYWIDLVQARDWLDGGSFSLVSPLDSQNRTDVELSEEQESWLEWIVAHDVSHIRLGN